MSWLTRKRLGGALPSWAGLSLHNAFCSALVACLCAVLGDWNIHAQSTPSLIVQPQDLPVRQGSNGTFTAEAVGAAPLRYQWRFNQTNIIAGGTNTSLTLTNVQLVNEGAYSVVVTNSFGSATSEVAHLSVLFRPVITVQPQGQTVALGAPATFSVSVTNNATLPITYLWRRGTTTVTNMSLYERTTTLEISNVRTNDAGGYTVAINSVAGSAVSGSAVLSVVFPVVAAGFSLAAEDCSAGNGVIDPGERVTVSLTLRSTNAPATTNLVATLLEEGGIRLPTGPQAYGGLASNGPPVARTFSFTADGSCGASNFATLRLFDGSRDLGRVVFPFRLGVVTSNAVSCCLESGATDVGLAITDTPDPATAGSNLVYTLLVTNRGPVTASGVTVTNLLPSGVSFVSVTASRGSCTNVGGVVVCNLGLLASGTTANIGITIQPPVAGTAIVNSASVSAQEPDYNSQNNAATAVTTIRIPAIVINDVTVNEGDNAVFDVRLSAPSAQNVTVSYATGNGTALAASDYIARAATLSFAPGETNRQILIRTLRDTVNELAERFFINLSGVVNASLPDTLAIGAINREVCPSLVCTGAVWKYLDNGSDQGTAWRGLNFDDTAWPRGGAPLGYDTSNLLSHATIVSFGSNLEDKYVTTYFRHGFDVADPSSISNLVVRLVRDDGGIVYLNGVEVFRTGMPAGSIAYNTWAAVVEDVNETTVFNKPIPPSLLRIGANILAVEIHQQRGESSDINFEFELLANSPLGNLPPSAVLVSPVHHSVFSGPTNVTLTASASDPDGTVRRVDFFTGTTLIGTVTNSPYTFIWSNAPPGYHSLIAQATDDGGVIGRSEAVGIAISVLAITSFTPASGPPGTPVTINGANFNPNPGSNIVFFGAVRATVTAATPTTLTAMAPLGATYAPLTVTVNGRTASARLPFVQTFDSSLVLDRFSFAPGVTLPGGDHPYRVIIHDLDGDLRPDIVVANQNDNTVSVYRNRGAISNISAVSFDTRINFGTGLVPYDLAIGDLNGDGRPEMVVANSAANTVSIFGNTSTPGSLSTNSFAPRVDLQVAAEPITPAIGDIDGDGKPDLVVASRASQRISVFRNLGGGAISTNSFATRVEFETGGSWGVVLTDFDGDGKLDMMGGFFDFGYSSGLRNTSTPGIIDLNSFSSYFELGQPLFHSESLAAGDLDGDGVPDLATSNRTVPPLGLFLRVLRNAAHPGSFTEESFEAVVQIPTFDPPNSPAIGDLDGDGRPEVVSGIRRFNVVAIVRNQSVPGPLTIASFAPHFYVPVGTYPNSMAIGDLDGDARPDVVSANGFGTNLTVLKNVTPIETAFVEFANSAHLDVSGFGPAPTYPSTILVAGFPNVAQKIRVILKDLTHTSPDDLDVLLVGPRGQTVMLMSDAGGDSDLSAVTLAFDDGSRSVLPDADLIHSGIYQPTDYDLPDSLSDPAPAGPYGKSLSAFGGTDPNGIWSLYVLNDAGGSAGSIAGGWQLAILPQPPGLSISDGRVVEGNAGTTNMVFTVQLANASSNLVVVDYSTANDNATAGTDYLARSGRLFFPAGTTNQTITITNNSDLVWESNERFFVNLFNATNAPISDPQGVGTIQDDDPPTVATLPFVEGFESGFFQPYWLVSGVRDHVTEITPNDDPHDGGLLHLRMDLRLPSLSARNELTLAINAAGWTNVVLRFWAKRFYDTPQTPPPSPFLDGADFDGVAISLDGTSWYEALGFRGQYDLTRTYQQYFVMLDEVVAANGLSYSSTFRIRFNRFGDNTTTIDGFAFDDISITGVRAGELHHFAWSPVPSPQPVNQPAPVTITAADNGNNIVGNFTGGVLLSAVAPDLTAGGNLRTVVGEPTETIFNNDGAFTFGFAFTPNTNLFVTHLRHYTGNKVSVWTSDGLLLASGNVTSTGNSWTETPLSAPILLLAGNRYVVSFHSADQTYHGTSLMATNFAHGTIEPGQVFAGQDAFPATIDSAQRYFIDLRYTVDTQPIPITPSNSGSFVNGAWTGNITVQQPAPHVFLLAEDGGGHRGAANRISVVAANDLSIGLAAFPNPVTITSNLNCLLIVSNSGPAASTGVVVRDTLPPGLAFLSANTSQGACGHAAGVVTCHLGTLAGGGAATIALVVRAEATGFLTNTATVTRIEAESYLPNNLAQVVSIITFPAISIDDLTITEGNSGSTEASFVVRLSAASSQNVTVDYATVPGSATAGADYVSTNGTLTFSPGVTLRTLSVAIVGDALDEAEETFRVRLTNAVRAVIADTEAFGAIRDNEPPANDHFVNRIALNGVSVTTVGSNADATEETDEPDHAGNNGGRSVWWRWTAPASGFATITTGGSDFDTVLAVYTGTTVSQLVLVAADNDSGSNRASQVTFEATTGITYQIAVDGVNGETGDIGLTLVLSSQPQFSPSDRHRRDFWSVDGVINAVIVTNGVVYVGGRFNYASPNGRTMVAYDTYTAEEDREFPEITSVGEQVILPDNEGGWFIGGQFEVGGRTNLIHVLNDNTIDPNFAPNPDNEVSALALSGEVLYVGGTFTRIGNTPRQRLAAIHLPTAATLPWAPQANGKVLAIAVSGSLIYAGGSFTFVGGQPRNYLAALDANMGQATAWNPNPDALVRTLALRDDHVFVGGDFAFISITRRGGLAVFDVNTGQLSDFYPDPGSVHAIRIVCDTVFIGGVFRNVGGLPRSRLAALDINTGRTLTNWNPGIDPIYSANNLLADVRSLAVAGNTLYVGGHFRKIGGQERTDLAAVDITTGQVLAWNPNPNGGVLALAVTGSKLLAGFESAPGGAERRNLAAFDTLTGKLTSWDPGADDTVWALAASGNNIYAGGEFLTVGGLQRTMLAAIDTTGLATGWNPSPNFGFSVYGLATSGSTLYAAGRFSTIGGNPRNNLAAVNLNTPQTTAWNPDANSVVYALGAEGNTIYAGGAFTTVGGVTRNRLAAIDSATAQLTNWNPDVSATVQTIAGAGGTIYVGGDFNAVAGQTHNRLAAIDAAFGQPTPWNPNANSPVRSLLISGNTLYVAGEFELIAGVQRRGFAAFDIASNAVLDWNPASSSISNSCLALALAGNTLYAGGNFSLARSSGQLRLAVFPGIGAPDITVPPGNPKVPQGTHTNLFVAAVGQQPFSYQWRFNGTNLPNATNASLAISNAQVTASGTYLVIVSNALGAITAEAKVTVLVPVVITLQPVSQTNSPGSSITLSVGATGNPPPAYQWRLNGVNIPGAVYPTLTLSNVQPRDSGSYNVVVANGVNAVSSDIASIVINSPRLPLTNDVADRMVILNASGVGSGSNVGATSEDGETNHVGKVGGSSVWISWLAPSNGIAIFNTRGSGFDTLLAVYRGTSVDDLIPVAADEDRGGFATSQAAFNAIAGIEYLIAIDGLGGASGNIVLSWSLDTTTTEFPRIIAHPLSVSVDAGDTVILSVEATSDTPLRYQWFKDCQDIPGATNDTLVLSNVRFADVGNYSVFVMNDSSQAARSFEALLEIGPVRDVFSQDKLEDLLAGIPPLSPSNFPPGTAASPSSGGGVLLVSLGTIDSQLLNNTTATTSLRETNHCGVLGGASKWLALRLTQSGRMQVDTIGSAIDTVLAVYRGSSILDIREVACNDDGAPDGIRSLLQFNGVANADYLLAVDGAGGTKGNISLNWRCGSAPTVSPPPFTNANVRLGGTLQLSNSVFSHTPDLAYQWRLNGGNIAGQTNALLRIFNLTAGQAGNYTVVVRNFAGSVTSQVVTVRFALGVPLGHGFDGPRFRVTGPAGQEYVIQATTNLLSWDPVFTNSSTTLSPINWTDLNSPLFSNRLYRVVPWP